jgi:hypothetical protein
MTLSLDRAPARKPLLDRRYSRARGTRSLSCPASVFSPW